MTQTGESVYSHRQPAPFPHAVTPWPMFVLGMHGRDRALLFVELGYRVLDHIEGR